MNTLHRRRLLMHLLAPGVLVSAAMSEAAAHGFTHGGLTLDHPYGLPGERGAAVHLRALRNTAGLADRLLGASTPAAGRVELQALTRVNDADQVRAVAAIELAPASSVPMRHDARPGFRLWLEPLRQPLRAGDRFELTLRFDRAGEVTVRVDVQAPRVRADRSS